MEKVVVENTLHLNQDILVVEQLLLKVLLVFMVKKVHLKNKTIKSIFLS
jgi:hypothetical protein